MLGLFARFVGRLPVGRKLLLIYLLDLSAVIYVSGILINEKYIAINFARKEVAGSAYIAEVRDVLTALPVPIVPDAAGKARASVPEPLQLDRWTRLLAQVEQQHGEGMASQDTSMELIQQLQKLAGRAALDKPLYYAIQDAGRELITRLGNQSNLILDPDLDSYYTMSLLVLRFPELQDLIGRLAGQSVEYAASSGEARTVLLNEMLISEGRLAATIKGIKSDYAEALAAGPAKLRADLAPGFTTLFAALEQFQLKTGYRGMTANPLDATAVAQLHQDTRAPMVRAWRQTSVSLDGMLSARISHLLSRMWLHLGTAAMLLLIILALVYFIARQIARPIRSLAGVADEVSRSGDYSVRATHDSRDEIGQLVTAFNSMLGELDLERAAREDLAATARAQEAQRALLESFPTPLIVTSIPEHRILHANQPAGAWLDGQTDDPWVKALSPAARAHYFQRMSDEDAVDGFEVQWQTGIQANGTPIRRWALLSGRRLTYQGAPAMLTAFTPIGQIKQLEQRLQLWAKVFEASSEAIAIFSVDRRLQIANMAFAKAGGWELSEVAGRTPEFLYSTHHENSFYEGVWQSTIIRGSWQGDVWLRRKNGSDYPAWMVANAVRDSTGQITHMVTSCVDVTEHKANEARIHHLAHHDGLTDLPNRSLCLERLTMALEQAARKQTPVAVVFIDLRHDPLGNTPRSMALLGEVLGRKAEADAFVKFWREQLALVTGRLARARPEAPTVFLENRVGLSEGCCDTMVGLVGKLLDAAGSRNVAKDLIPGEFGTLNPELLIARQPRFYIGTGIGSLAGAKQTPLRIVLGADATPQAAQASLARAVQRRGIAQLQAVQQGRAYAMWHHFYNSPFNVVAVQVFAKWLHPELFADIDPRATLQAMYERFQPIPLEGVYWTQLKP